MAGIAELGEDRDGDATHSAGGAGHHHRPVLGRNAVALSAMTDNMAV